MIQDVMSKHEDTCAAEYQRKLKLFIQKSQKRYGCRCMLPMLSKQYQHVLSMGFGKTYSFLR